MGKSDYKAWIAIDTSDTPTTIQTANCTCPAGNGHACSHVAAIAYAIIMSWEHGLAGESCTDKAVTWGKGSATTNNQAKITNIDFSRPSKSRKPTVEINNNLSPHAPMRLKKFETHEELTTSVASLNIADLWNSPNTMLHKIITAKREPISTTDTQHTHSSHELNYTDGIPYIDCDPCRQFYSRYVDITREQQSQLKQQTIDQSQTDLWFTSRKMRLTASTTGSVPKTDRADPSRFVTNHLYPRFKGTAATRKGTANEPLARTKFMELTGIDRVELSGTVICPTEPYLSASPDGLIDNDTILEIKRPQKPPTQLASSGKYDIIVNNGEYQLNPKGKNSYYTQVQMTMYCTGTRYCQFFVWDDKSDDHVLVTVDYDRTFVQNILPRLRAFYFQHLLVRVVDEVHVKRLTLCQSYRNLCSQ